MCTGSETTQQKGPCGPGVRVSHYSEIITKKTLSGHALASATQ